MRSRRHQGDSSISCPFCRADYTTAAGLAHHLERGACSKASTDRELIYRMVRRKDPKGLISKNLLEWPDAIQHQATEVAWNSNARAYQCYFCRRTFGKLFSLNQHLSSPAHQQPLYHCPNQSCRKDYVTLGALINHLESESCRFIRFEAVQRQAYKLIQSNRLIQF